MDCKCETCIRKDCPERTTQDDLRVVIACYDYLDYAKPMTNADRIRAMSDEELCDFLHKKTWLCESHQLCVDCPKYHKEKGCLSTDEWLKQPAEVE